MSDASKIAHLLPATLDSYVQYVGSAEKQMAGTLQPDGPFLWSSGSDARAHRVAAGKTIAEPSGGDGPIAVQHGLIHDWTGATRVPGATLGNVLALMQDYDRHREVYAPEVADSRLVRRDGDLFEIYLRLKKKKIVSVVLDTDHHVEYAAVAPHRSHCSSYTTRVAEVNHPGKVNEFVTPPDTGYGYLWRMNSYWRLEQRDGAVWVECRAISLTRDIPKALAWIIDPIVLKLPRESLIATLEATRRGYTNRFLRAPATPSELKSRA